MRETKLVWQETKLVSQSTRLVRCRRRLGPDLPSLVNRWRTQVIAPPGAAHDASRLAGAATTPGPVRTNAGNHVPSDASSTMVLLAAGRRDRPLVQLDRAQWTRLYKEVTLKALQLTHTKVRRLEYTARDRAQEAVQRAFERFLRIQPADVKTLDEARSWLVWRVRSELWNVKEREVTRKEAEAEAVVEDATVRGTSGPSPEQMQLDAAQESRQRTRAQRIVDALREELKKSGDTLALATIDLIANDKTAPEEQARQLGVGVDEIYNARKRRKRAMEKVVARIDAEEKKDE